MCSCGRFLHGCTLCPRTRVPSRPARRSQEFWSRMTHVISDKNTRVWGALEKQLDKYLALLQVRGVY